MVPYIALFAWPIVAYVLFTRHAAPKAATLTIIFGYLLMPESIGVDLPLIPELNKTSLVNVSAVLMIALGVGLAHSAGMPGRLQPAHAADSLRWETLPGWVPKSRPIQIAFVTIFASFLLTVLTNGDRMVFTTVVLPGLRLYDGVSLLLGFLASLLPFLVGRKMLGHPDQHIVLLKILVVAAFAYSFLALYEIRASPQLNKMIYGFFPHSWAQHYRAGGWRPLVFLEHGLLLGIFMFAAVLAAVSVARLEISANKGKFIMIALWLFGTLYLCKTLGAFMIMLVLLPIILFMNVRMQMMAAMIISVVILTYPMLRGAGLVPLERMVSFAESIDERRASSLEFRLTNEEDLLTHANKRPLFGWGVWGRNRARDPVTGVDNSVTDGQWVIVVGTGGWLGYLSQFGLLAFPIILLFWRQRKYEITLATSSLCVIVAGNMVDLIPNSGLTPVTWLMAGALAGRVELGPITASRPDDDDPDPEASPPRGPVYTRQQPADRKTRRQWVRRTAESR